MAALTIFWHLQSNVFDVAHLFQLNLLITLFVCFRTVSIVIVYLFKISVFFFPDTLDTVNFALEEWTSQNTKKSWCQTEKMSSNEAFQFTIVMVGLKLVASKTFLWSCQSTGKSTKLFLFFCAFTSLVYSLHVYFQETKVNGTTDTNCFDYGWASFGTLIVSPYLMVS